MSFEIELKIKVPDFGPVRERLAELDAECRGKVLERNVLFDYPDQRLATSDQGLRVRMIVEPGGG